MKDFKPPLVDVESHGSRGIGCGCFLGGCGMVVLLFMLMCVGSYYSMMHTSLPLTLIKRGLEEDGKIRIEGLRGTISNGFEMDKLEFEGYGGKWSELRDVKFRFNGIYDLAANGRIIVQEASVGGGTIYAELEESDEFDPSLDSEWEKEFSEELEELNDELSDSDMEDLKELRIDLVRVSDLTIINPDTELSLKIQQAHFKNFRVLKGQVTNLGNIEVRSDHLDLITSPSELFGNDDLSWHLDGKFKSSMHKKVLQDVAFQVDLAIGLGNQIRSQVNLMNGQLLVKSSPDGAYEMQLSDFSLGELYQLDPPLAPSRWNLGISVPPRSEPVANNAPPEHSRDASAETSTENTEDDNSDGEAEDENPPATARVMDIAEGSYFYLGDHKFEIETKTAPADAGSMNEPFLTATTDLDGVPVKALVNRLRKSPFVSITLSSENGPEPRDLWAKLFFGNAYDGLGSDQKAQVDRSLSQHKTQPTEPVDF